MLNVKGVIIITLYQLCHLADEYKQKRGITIASKRLAWEDRKEEREELGGMIFISPPCFKPPETPITLKVDQRVC